MLLIIFLTQNQHPHVAHHAVNPGQRSLYTEGFLRQRESEICIPNGYDSAMVEAEQRGLCSCWWVVAPPSHHKRLSIVCAPID